MPKVLLTAFEPYDHWKSNASWLALMHLTGQLPANDQLTTRLLPVNFDLIRGRLAEELKRGYDVALFVGQSPGSTRVQLESVGLNVAGHSGQLPEDHLPLYAEGPQAYRSELPLGDWARKIRAAGIPAQVSHYAGTFLCNATIYWSHLLIEQMALKTQAAFIHLPLDLSQVVGEKHPHPSLPVEYSALAIRLVLEELGI